MEKLLYEDPVTGVLQCSSRNFGKIFDRLHAYEELDMTPEDIEQTMLRFSSFLMEMTGGRMSKTNYTVQAMVAEANDHQQRECDECYYRNEMDKVMADLEGMQNSYQQLQEINDRTYRANMAMGKDLEWAINYLRECGGCAGCKYEDEQETAEPCAHCQRITLQGEDKWEFHGATDTNVTTKEEV